MTITDADAQIRERIRDRLEVLALGESYSFMCGPTLPPGSPQGALYMVALTRPSPVIGETLKTLGLITIPVDPVELDALLEEMVGKLQASASAVLGVGFKSTSAPA